MHDLADAPPIKMHSVMHSKMLCVHFRNKKNMHFLNSNTIFKLIFSRLSDTQNKDVQQYSNEVPHLLYAPEDIPDLY